jgi:hypothetical protein
MLHKGVKMATNGIEEIVETLPSDARNFRFFGGSGRSKEQIATELRALGYDKALTSREMSRLRDYFMASEIVDMVEQQSTTE